VNQVDTFTSYEIRTRGRKKYGDKHARDIGVYRAHHQLPFSRRKYFRDISQGKEPLVAMFMLTLSAVSAAITGFEDLLDNVFRLR